MASGRKTLRLSVYFIMKHNGSRLYLKEIINLPILLEFESIKRKFPTFCPLSGGGILFSFSFQL